MASDPRVEESEEGPGIVLLLIVGAALLLLATGTFLLAGVPMGGWSTPVALAFAVAKAALIVGVFMELGYHRGGSRFGFGVSVFFVLLLITFVVLDVKTRFPPTRPPGPHPVLEGKGSPTDRYQHPAQTSGPRGQEE
jgi:cytochrome c oxidase subunit 4